MSIWGNFLIASHSASTVRSRSIFSSVSFPFGPKFYFYTPADYLCVGIVSQYIRIRVGLLSCHIVFSLVAFQGQSAWTSQVVPGHWCFLCDLERQRCQGHSLGFLQHFRLRQCWGTARIRAPIPIFLLQSSQKCLKSLGKHAEKTLETTCAASSSSTSSPDKSCKVHVTMDKRQGTFKAF